MQDLFKIYIGTQDSVQVNVRSCSIWWKPMFNKNYDCVTIDGKKEFMLK